MPNARYSFIPFRSLRLTFMRYVSYPLHPATTFSAVCPTNPSKYANKIPSGTIFICPNAGCELCSTFPPHNTLTYRQPLSVLRYSSKTISAPIPGQTMSSNCRIPSNGATEPSCATLWRYFTVPFPAAAARRFAANSATKTP